MSLTKAHNRMILGAAVNVLDYGMGETQTSSDNASALSAAISTGLPLFIPNGTYNIDTGGFKFESLVHADDATLNFTNNVSVAIQLGLNANIQGKLTIDVSTVSCTSGILISGSDAMDHDTAPRCENITLIGNNHTDSVNGLLLDSLTARTPANLVSAVQYCKLNQVTVSNFQAGCHLRASESVIADSWVNANIFNDLTIVGCMRSIILDGQNNGEIAANVFNNYTTQYGSVLGSAPTNVIELIGNSTGNTLNGFIFDWDPFVNDNPVVSFSNNTRGNYVSSSAAAWQVKDEGTNNQYKSNSPELTKQWVGPYNGSFLGLQSNCLANFSTSGLLSGAASTTGTSSVSVTSGSVLNVESENDTYLELTYTAGTGEATYTVEFDSLSIPIDEITTVGFLFEEGYEAKKIRVEMDFNGVFYEVVAEITPNVNSQAFLVLDRPIPKNTIFGIRFKIQATDNRVVRVRQLFANGIMPKTFVSRGGDAINGDLVFHQSAYGPVLKDTVTGNAYRLTVTSGSLTLTAAPTTKTTYL